MYGTLVPNNGFANFQTVLGKRVDLFPPGTDPTKTNTAYTAATAPGWKIYHLHGFPGCTPSTEETDVVVGALVWPHGTEADYVATVLEADRLEKFNGVIGGEGNEYQRIEITTHLTSGEAVQAWMYECLLDTSSAHQVSHGNWPKYMRENNLQSVGADWSTVHASAKTKEERRRS